MLTNFLPEFEHLQVSDLFVSVIAALGKHSWHGGIFWIPVRKLTEKCKRKKVQKSNISAVNATEDRKAVGRD